MQEIITQNTTWNTFVHATDTIIISNGVTLTITSQVRCEENTAIIVQPGGKLVIDGGVLAAACPNELWQGIVVLGNKNQPQTPQYQGTVELKSGAIIEHALCAISAASVNYRNATGGIIIADSAIFRNNVLAVEYRPYENKNASGAVIDNIGKFTNCTFTVNNTDRFDANGKTYWHHVNMWGVRGVTFEGCAFKNDIDVLIGRLPAPYNYGIYTMDAGFKVKNYCKSGGSTGADCPCLLTHTTPSGFYRLTEGIRSENTGQPYYIHIDQSKFYDLGTGARMNDQTNYRLTRCGFSDVTTGLSSANSSGYKIEANDFSIPVTSALSATGISMSNSGGAENKIYKNDFKNLDKGISVQLINNSPFQITQGLQLLSNAFTNNNYDIYISSGATVRSNQGNSSSGADNKFIGTTTSSIFSQGLQPQAITYYHSPGGNKAPINPTSNVTVIGNASPGPTSSTLCDVTYRMEILSDSLEQYKSMQQQYDEWFAQLKDNPELLQELLALSDAMRELSDHAISRILGDSILYLESLKPWYKVVRTPVAKYSLAEVHFYERKYDQAEMVLNEIPNMFEYSESEMTEHNNYIRFYNFKKQLQLADRNWTQLDETEIVYLQTIAEATNGRSASMAQGVLCFFFDICYEDKIEEGEEGGEVIPPTKNMATETQLSDNQIQNLDYELSLYPNPTSSEMTVTLNNPAVKIVAMELYDLFGKKVHQQTVNQSYGTLKMNELAQGVYILKVRLSLGEVVIRKVVKN
ncbi:MAG: T9SS type A sorting domain-containing protein [Bacteroidales bacterium]|nr:T9SS type A sorting domain-containing protein [Bacteroidales bacterium]